MPMRDALWLLAIAGFIIAVGCFASYHMALAGHPNAYWLWHTFLGVM